VTIPATLITASVTEFPIITSDVTAISETKSEIIGTYDNSDDYLPMVPLPPLKMILLCNLRLQAKLLILHQRLRTR
jgi:hypothetical protein